MSSSAPATTRGRRRGSSRPSRRAGSATALSSAPPTAPPCSLAERQQQADGTSTGARAGTARTSTSALRVTISPPTTASSERDAVRGGAERRRACRPRSARRRRRRPTRARAASRGRRPAASEPEPDELGVVVASRLPRALLDARRASSGAARRRASCGAMGRVRPAARAFLLRRARRRRRASRSRSGTRTTSNSPRPVSPSAPWSISSCHQAVGLRGVDEGRIELQQAAQPVLTRRARRLCSSYSAAAGSKP